MGRVLGVNPIRRIGAAFKQFAMTFATGSRYWFTMLGRTRFDYRAEVGTGRGNAAVMACVLWFCRTFPEAPILVSRIIRDGEDKPLPDHPLKMLLDTPNPYYSGELLWYGTLADWMLTGNAYWIKVRAGTRRVVELWWVPSNIIEPKWPDDGSAYISHYEYTPNGLAIRLEVNDVVHFRYGLDPVNTRKGCSPLTALFREIFTDDEAANYTASMLRNVGVPPVIVSPKEEVKLSQDDADQVKARFAEVTTGDNRGQAIVMKGGTDVVTLGFNPQQMDTKTSRRVPEERISAIFGTPAVVVGLGAGLDRSTFANFAEAREAAYESNVIPSQRLLAAELRTQLLPEFGDPRQIKIEFDLSEVRVLQDDQNALFERAGLALNKGIASLNESREMVGLKPLPDGDVLYIPSTVTPTDPTELIVEVPVADPELPPAEGLPPSEPRALRGAA